MKKLEGPAKRYITGAFPSHSSFETLGEHFGLELNALRFVLQKEGWLSMADKPTKRAANDDLVDVVDGEFLWKVDLLLDNLNRLGNSFSRHAVNQNLPESSGEPQWANLGTIGTYFSVSAKKVGDWLDELDLRDEGMANDSAMEQGLATVVEMNTGQGKNQTRKINYWNLHATIELLMSAGHYLDFDYAKTLKGSGHNSDVRVETIDDRAKVFAKEFSALFKDKVRRRELPEIVRRTASPILKKAELLLGRPGFITSGEYTRYLDRE